MIISFLSFIQQLMVFFTDSQGKLTFCVMVHLIISNLCRELLQIPLAQERGEELHSQMWVC